MKKTNGDKYEKRAEIFGGVMLILMGIILSWWLEIIKYCK